MLPTHARDGPHIASNLMSDELVFERLSKRTEAAAVDRALMIVYAHLPADVRRQAIAAHTTTDLPPSGVWIARRGPDWLAAIRIEVLPGHSAVVHVPRIALANPVSPLAALLDQVVRHAAASGVLLVQSLLPIDHGDESQALRSAGFCRSAELLQMVCVAPAQCGLSESRLSFEPFDGKRELRLAGLIGQTYQGSLDCAELDDWRSVADVLAGYRAIGRHDPSHWQIARSGTNDVGCLLLAEHAGTGTWELTYMGVVPAKRGRGYGRELLREARRIAFTAGAERLVLSVDAANRPAVEIYLDEHFTVWDRREVYLRRCAAL